LLKAGNPTKGRRRVLAIIDALSKGIIANDGFRSAMSRRIASVDQLWAWLLLQQFTTTHQQQPRLLLPPVAYLISATALRRAVASGAVILIGALGTLCSVVDGFPTVLRAVGGTTAAVCLGFLASLWVVWARGD
jgi:hypothetical protein